MGWTQDAGVAPAQSGAQAYQQLMDDGPLHVFGHLKDVLSAAKHDAQTYDQGLNGLTSAVSPAATDPLAKARVQTFLGSLGDEQSLQPEHAAPDGDPQSVRAHAAGWSVSKLFRAHRDGLLSGTVAGLAQKIFDEPHALTDADLGVAQTVASKFQEQTANLDPDLKLPKGYRFLRFDSGPDGVRPFVEVDPEGPGQDTSPARDLDSGSGNPSSGWFTARQPWDGGGGAAPGQPSRSRLLSGAREGERLAVVKGAPDSEGLVASPNPDGTMALFGKKDQAPRAFYPAQDLRQDGMFRLVNSVPTIVANIDDQINHLSASPLAHVQVHSSPALHPAFQDGAVLVVESKPEHAKALQTMFSQAGFHASLMLPHREQIPAGEGEVKSQRRVNVVVPVSGNTKQPWDIVKKAQDDHYDVRGVAYGFTPEGTKPAHDNFYVDPAGRQVVARTATADPFASNAVPVNVPEGLELPDHTPEGSVRDVKVNGNRVLVNGQMELVVPDGHVEHANDFLQGKASPFTLSIPAHPYRQDGATPAIPSLTLGQVPETVPSRTVVGHVEDGKVSLEAPADPEDVGQMLLHQARLVLGSIGIKA